MDIFSFFTDILIFLRTFTDKSFWVKFLRTARKFTDGWQPGFVHAMILPYDKASSKESGNVELVLFL